MLVMLILCLQIRIPVTIKIMTKVLLIQDNHRSVIRNLNINCIFNKFVKLKLIIQGKIDILVITKNKTDSTFPLNQFTIQGYAKPYTFDGN